MPMDNQGNPRSGFGRMNHANASYGAKAAKPAAPSKAKPADGMGGGEKPAGEEHMHAHSHKGGEHDISKMPMHEAVKEHGPATHMFSEHDHEGGTHHVHTVHGEKHHHSDHESAEAAHEHMGHAMGMGGEGEAEAYGGEETPDEEMAESKSGGIPGIS